ncbi:MAG: glycosyltransferase [Candidatus Firestonebacteria bacterium]
MKISILTENLNSNSLGRAYILGEILKEKYTIEIIGPKFDKSIWFPLITEETNFKSISGKHSILYYKIISAMLKETTGNIIYICKPFFVNLIPGLIQKFFFKKPLILDIDDWELGLSKESYIKLSLLKKIKNFLSSIKAYYSYWNIFFVEKLIPLADEITVSNSFLQKKFGGTIIPHIKNTEIFNPEHFDRNNLRKKIGIKDEKVIGFIGTPREHKGIENLINAISIITNKNLLLLLVGLDNSKYNKQLRTMIEEKLRHHKFKIFSEQPIAKLPEFLAISDIIVIPQKYNWATKGQVPAKLFDAMAMAKPIIATDVGDMPQILENCGIIVKADDISALAKKIIFLSENSEFADSLGKKAREKCIEKYSFTAIKKTLFNIFDKYEMPKQVRHDNLEKQMKNFLKNILKKFIPSQALWLPRYYTLFKKIKFDKNDIVLDAGCGEGLILLKLLKKCSKITGIDLNDKKIDGIYKKIKTKDKDKFNFVPADMTHLPFSDNFFDKIISLDAIDEIENDIAVFNEFSRVLKPNGKIIISIPHNLSPSAKLFNVQKLLRKFLPKFLYTRDFPDKKAWFEITEEYIMKKLGYRRLYTVEYLKKTIPPTLKIVHYEYTLKTFSAIAADIVYGIRGLYILRPLLFFIAVRLDYYLSKDDIGYVLFVELTKTK